MKDWEKWLFEQRAKSEMTVRQIPLTQVQLPWGLKPDGDFRREPSAFFNITGAEIQANREVSAWSQPIIAELGKGVVALVGIKGKYKFLLTARQEPGNPAEKSHILLGPTIQASESNLLQKHGGKRPPFVGLLDEHGKSIKWVEISQDGGKFLEKVNRYGVLWIDDEKEINLTTNARWFTGYEIVDALTKGELNEHLVQVMAVFACQTGME